VQPTTSTQPTEPEALADVSFRLSFHQVLLGPSGTQNADSEHIRISEVGVVSLKLTENGRLSH
jgi:hypothetical protein